MDISASQIKIKPEHLLAVLTDQQKIVLCNYYGINSYGRRMTQTDIAAALGITVPSVKSSILNGLNKWKNPLFRGLWEELSRILDIHMEEIFEKVFTPPT